MYFIFVVKLLEHTNTQTNMLLLAVVLLSVVAEVQDE